ncbi:MAG: endonuclease MutS2, partial [Selenomonadaceae bacterium]|nr:endonuclease MutS2 [Selenomonadaceae bacterium]
METEAFKVLEYKRILSKLQEKAGSALGKELAMGLRPSSDMDEVKEYLQQTAEAVAVSAVSSPPLGGIKDIREMLKKVGIGAVLAPDELLEIFSTMYAMRCVKKYFKELEMEAPVLKSWASNIELLGNLERQIENTVDEHGVIRDDASSELKRLRREIKGTQAKIKDSLNKIVHDANNQKYFQDNIVTMRGDRYVVPVKLEYKNYFPGIVHDQSATGSTLFVEP